VIEHLGLFVSAFAAATILPMSSEAVLAGLLLAGGQPPWSLFATASLANTLGSCVNWVLGRFIERFAGRRWFPVGPAALARAGERFRHYGLWSLLFAWVPIVGDPLTVAAGALGVRFLPFVLLVGAGKAARYAAIVWLAV